MVLDRSSRRSTICVRKAWRVGTSKAFTRPAKMLKATTCQTSIAPDASNSASRKAWIMAAVCVASSVRRLSQRSVSTPAMGARKKAGIWPEKPTTPSQKAEPVRRNTSQLKASCCIQVPISEIPWPRMNSRKLRCAMLGQSILIPSGAALWEVGRVRYERTGFFDHHRQPGIPNTAPQREPPILVGRAESGFSARYCRRMHVAAR